MYTSSSLEIQNGADIRSVADRHGYASTRITTDVYCHSNDASIAAAGSAARDAIRRAQEKTEAGSM